MFYKNKKIIEAFLFLLLPSVALAEPEPSYLCISDQVAGFSYEGKNKDWKAFGAISSREKLVLKESASKSRTDDPVIYRVFDHGSDFPNMHCKDGFSDDWISCRGVGGIFYMSLNDMRYLHIYESGYVGEEGKTKGDHMFDFAEGDNEPHMTIGKCSKI
ncbi:MAG: hypothetical protein RLT87_06230 [Gammaproteobacteria bacterium]